VRSINLFRIGVGLPAIAVFITVIFWYLGDVYYNDYQTHHSILFDSSILDLAWWQVALFLFAFQSFLLPIHKLVNVNSRFNESQIDKFLFSKKKIEFSEFQLQIIFKGCLFILILLFFIAWLKLDSDFLFFIFPWSGKLISPWSRGQIGGGFDSLLSLANYFNIFVAAIFGVIAALTRDKSLRFYSLICCFFTWPVFFIDRARNIMLAVALPGLFAFIFIKLRRSFIFKLFFIFAIYLLFDFWFKIVLQFRDTGGILAGINSIGYASAETGKHYGLNMFEELCWINNFIQEDQYHINFGKRYLAELVNFIPRGLWPDKPLIGFDYAILRGQTFNSLGWVTATVSTGLIGQGVVNFGVFFGPVFVGLLMSVWVALLAKLDLNSHQIGYLPLYLVGLTLTINMGRDITFITLYTFIFGWFVAWWVQRRGLYQEPR
jgi:hypothetical protein